MRLLITMFSIIFFFQSISISISSDFPHGLNEKELSIFLMKEMDVDSEQCINVKKLGAGGVSTEQLFKAKIDGTCLLEKKDRKLIIKEVSFKNFSEIENLLLLKKSNVFKSLPNDIQIILPIGIYRVDGHGVVLNEEKPIVITEGMIGGYIETEEEGESPQAEDVQINLPLNDPIYFEVMEEAEGKEISKIFMDNYPNINNIENQATIKAYAKALAILHQTFMDPNSIPKSIEEIENLPTYKGDHYKTLVHQDAHWGNLFYDLVNDVVRFIDNEGFTSTLQRKATIIIDLYRVAFYSSSAFGYCRDKRYDPGKCDYSIEIGAQVLKNYIENYPIEQQDKLRAYIKKYMLYYAIQNKMLMDKDGVNKWEDILNSL
jgi:hypothetical protein